MRALRRATKVTKKRVTQEGWGVRTAVAKNPYEFIHRVLSAQGIVVLHKGRAPANPVNLFDMLVAQGQRITIEVDDTFVEEMRNLAKDFRR
jgi:hypothetical protein